MKFRNSGICPVKQWYWTQCDAYLTRSSLLIYAHLDTCTRRWNLILENDFITIRNPLHSRIFLPGVEATGCPVRGRCQVGAGKVPQLGWTRAGGFPTIVKRHDPGHPGSHGQQPGGNFLISNPVTSPWPLHVIRSFWAGTAPSTSDPREPQKHLWHRQQGTGVHQVKLSVFLSFPRDGTKSS
jgi:hypothetical protein